ncbi:hypothetical protein [Listeria goaensis]|uniref:hypothetical protein n=1 Tax=Listeria goaensis TaxID=1649188 RepID=UPI000B5975A3|nr:hypothetical protein [Listeria goaensis]
MNTIKKTFFPALLFLAMVAAIVWVVPSQDAEAAVPENNLTYLLTWQAPTGEIDYYTIYRDGLKIGTTSGTGFYDMGLAHGTTYKYRIDATYKNGHVQIYCSYPRTYTTAGTNDLTCKITWRASSSDVEYYVVYRDDIVIFTTDGLSFVDRNLTPGETYRYNLQAVDRAGNKSVKTAPLYYTAPSN